MPIEYHVVWERPTEVELDGRGGVKDTKYQIVETVVRTKRGLVSELKMLQDGQNILGVYLTGTNYSFHEEARDGSWGKAFKLENLKKFTNYLKDLETRLEQEEPN